ncbi:MAG: alginate export family protein [Candidatus Omnitrophica bacterium]|nr:alginate export family protein [Candidatus Omnitrophota bacterium]
MKKWGLGVWVLMVLAVLVLPAQAEVQNIKVDGSVTVRGFLRDNYSTTGSGGGLSLTGFSENESQDWYNSIALLGVSADLTDNVAARVQIGNERDWGTPSTASTDVQLYEAYLTFKEMLLSPLTVSAGRMPVKLGDGLFIGDGVTNETSIYAADYSAQKSFDGITGALDFDPVVVTLGTLKIQDQPQRQRDDTDIYFVDAAYTLDAENKLVWNSQFVTLYYNSPGPAVSGTGPSSLSTEHVSLYGLATGIGLQPEKGLTAKLGAGAEFGTYENTPTADRKIKAWAMDAGIGMALEMIDFGGKYVYRSGQDWTSTTGDYKSWYPMFEDQLNGIIYDPNTNTSSFALTARMMPVDKLTLTAELWYYLLAKRQTVDTTLGTKAKKEAGTELDVLAKYAYTEDVSLGLEIAWFFPGEYYDAKADGTRMDRTGFQAVAELGVKF